MTWKVIASNNRRDGPDIHLQRSSVRFYYINFRVTKRHAGPFTSQHGTNTLVLPRRLSYTDLTVHMDLEANLGLEISRNDKIGQRISTWHN